MRRVGIVSLGADLHAHAVAKKLRERFGCKAHVFPIDEAHQTCLLNWDGIDGTITNYHGDQVRIGDLDVVWWRRARADQGQDLTAPLFDQDVFEFVSAEWRFAYPGLWTADFRGLWVNDPRADLWATSKQTQLRTATQVGLHVPKTLISNDPARIREFCALLDGNVVVKKIAGVPGKSFATVEINTENLNKISNDSLRLAPAVYQEKISAEAHYRVLSFGRLPVFVKFSSPYLDWRRSLPVRPHIVEVSTDLTHQVNRFLDELDLRMGIIDFVIDAEGREMFLELNPQGQFLFLEGLGDIDTTTPCAQFLAGAQ
jgi:hypothetical protein